MLLFDALKTIRARSTGDEEPIRFSLLCGLTPLHLRTFLTAELLQRMPAQGVDVQIGLFGDLIGNIERSIESPPNGAAVVIEWSDLDARLGFRSAFGWRPNCMADIVQSLTLRIGQLRNALVQLAESTPIAVSMPTLPLPPMFTAPGGSADITALQIRHQLQDLSIQLHAANRIRVVDPQRLDAVSPPGERFDAASELRSGFPYTNQHASALASQLAELLRPATALKGLITDLDNTLWSGIVGEDGVDGISWDLDRHTQQHALYQEMLASFAEIGVLVAVASRNDPAVVGEALRRRDLIVPAEKLFPVEANWGPKSQSVARILQAWNISADSVVFIDDSPIELAEASAAFPELNCRQFPVDDEAAVVELLYELRDLFGRTSVVSDDSLRIESIRAASELKSQETDSEAFLAAADAEISFEWNQPDERCLQLVNKTNQFNLNGRRIDEFTWHRQQQDPECFVLAVSYRDRFAPLGKISVVSGRHSESTLYVDSWVLSCRAFSRRIEHAVLAALFQRFGVDRLQLDFAATSRNGPMRTCLTELLGTEPVSGPVDLTREIFQNNCPNLYARVSDDEPDQCSIAA
jgi:FkbH-like protein